MPSEFRSEKKYICSEAQLRIIEARLRPLMQPDSHRGSDGAYWVRSVYFDDMDNRYLRENLTGLDNRVKYRIRTYGGTDEVIRLEAKHKIHGMTKKESCALTREEAEKLLSGGACAFSRELPQPLRMLAVELNTTLLRPRVLVSYQRTAYVYRTGNVRITFDRNVASTPKVRTLFDERLPLEPVLPPGRHILEVKFDELIPDPLLQVMEIGELMQTPFSKYVMSRMPL